MICLANFDKNDPILEFYSSISKLLLGSRTRNPKISEVAIVRWTWIWFINTLCVSPPDAYLNRSQRVWSWAMLRTFLHGGVVLIGSWWAFGGVSRLTQFWKLPKCTRKYQLQISNFRRSRFYHIRIGIWLRNGTN